MLRLTNATRMTINNVYYEIKLQIDDQSHSFMFLINNYISTYSGISTIVVNPPYAAALVAVVKPSQSVLPGSLM